MPARFTLRQLEYLVAVGQVGSVTLAAERMHVSAPSISIALAQLEAELGLPLFIRKHTQGMTVTPAGREIIREAIATLAAARTLSDLAEEFHGTIKGSLNLGCLLTFAQILVPRLRRSFIDLHPDVAFYQTETHQATLIKGMLDGTLDVALTYDLALPPDLTFIDLGKLPPFVTVPAGHPLTQLETVTIADLAGYPLVLLDLPYSNDYFLSLFEKAGVKPLNAVATWAWSAPSWPMVLAFPLPISVRSPTWRLTGGNWHSYPSLARRDRCRSGFCAARGRVHQ